MKGIFVAMIVMNWMLVSRGRLAMNKICSPTYFTSNLGSGAISMFACMVPSGIRLVIGVAALPMSIWEHEMSYLRPSSEVDRVRPVTPCFVAA